jgi:predicted dinucleotide-binding enzyme
MKISVLGTGKVARGFAEKLGRLGHEVVLGTRDVERTFALTEKNDRGTVPFKTWHDEHRAVQVLPLAEAAACGEVVINATRGERSLATLEQAGAANLAGKVLLDVTVPLDYSEFPPTLSIVNDDSLGERIQRTYPEARVVKSFTTLSVSLMTDPRRLPGPHDLFVAGDDPAAKDTVKGLLCEIGWAAENIIDMGGIRAARGLEMYARFYYELAGALGTWNLNIHVVRGG